MARTFELVALPVSSGCGTVITSTRTVEQYARVANLGVFPHTREAKTHNGG